MSPDATNSYLLSQNFPASLVSRCVGAAIDPGCCSLSAEPARLLVRIDISGWLLPETKELVPCLTGLFSSDYCYQVSLSLLTAEAQTVECSLSWVGNVELMPPRLPQASSPLLTSQIDLFSLATAARSAQICFDIRGVTLQEWQERPWIISLSQRSAPTQEQQCTLAGGAHQLTATLPAYSQFAVLEIGARICSPTCIAMLLGATSTPPPSPLEVATIAYCKEHDLYGVWPYALYAASRFGKLGQLCLFADWGAAKALLDQEQAIVASVRYGRGELTGAALERERPGPAGHLVVLRGYQLDKVLVLDPAAKDVVQVPREYSLKEFLQIWLGRSGLGYVLL